MDTPYIIGVTPTGLVVLGTVAIAYALSVTMFLALQNRSPQSTFAWTLLFVVQTYLVALLEPDSSSRPPDFSLTSCSGADGMSSAAS